MPAPELPPIVAPAFGASRVHFSHSLATAAIDALHGAGAILDNKIAERRQLSWAPLESWRGVHSQDFRGVINTEQRRRNALAEQAQAERRQREASAQAV